MREPKAPLTEKLSEMFLVQLGTQPLAFDQDHDFPISHDGIVNLFALLSDGICREFRHDFRRIEDIIPEASEERQND